MACPVCGKQHIDMKQVPRLWSGRSKRLAFLDQMKKKYLYLRIKSVVNNPEGDGPPLTPPVTPSTANGNKKFDKECAEWRSKMKEWNVWLNNQSLSSLTGDGRPVQEVPLPLKIDIGCHKDRR